MLVKLSKTIDYYAEINTEGFGNDVEALRSFMNTNVRYGIDAFMKPSPNDNIEVKVIFDLPEGVPINRFGINEKTGLLKLEKESKDAGR